MENSLSQQLFRCRIHSDVVAFAGSLAYSEKIAQAGTYETTLPRIQRFQQNDTNAIITFIIPTLDRHTLMRTLQTLLNQTNSRWCAMIIFDGCEPKNDEVKQLLETDPRFFYMCINRHGSTDYPKHSAAGTVRNIAMNLVVTPWIGFVDDDDLLFPEYVEKLVEEITITPNVEAIAFRMEVENQLIPNTDCREIRNGQIGISFALHSNLISNGFIFIQSDNEDFNLMNRICHAGRTIVISPYLTYYVNEIGNFPLVTGASRCIINEKPLPPPEPIHTNDLVKYDGISRENPLVLAYYFAQYHSIPQNDQIFGDGFTDWDLFKNTHLDLSNCKFPLETSNGLGYYDPTQRDVRIRQAELAKKYGIDGFVFYHYWLENQPVMTNVLELMLKDNEPDMPFCLCFANESWKHCYGSKTKEYKSNHSDGTTFRQLYDDPVRHAAFLEPLFKHKNYIKINGAPVFFVYRFTTDVYRYMDQISNELKKVGIDRIYLIANTSIYCLSKYDQSPLVRSPDAHSPFLAHMLKQVGPWHMPDYVGSLPCLYSGLTGWDCNPRHGESVIVDHSPETLAKNTYADLMKMYNDATAIPMYVLFAWNEWGEGAVLEPNTKYGEELGYAIQKGKKMYQSVLSFLTRMKFEYGIENQYKDITNQVFAKCIQFVGENDWEVSIPIVDDRRDELFGDPLPGIHKLIKVTYNDETKIYDETQQIVYSNV